MFAPPAHPQPGARLAVVFGFHGNHGDAAQEVASTAASLDGVNIEPGRLNPIVVEAMRERGIDIAGNRARSRARPLVE